MQTATEENGIEIISHTGEETLELASEAHRRFILFSDNEDLNKAINYYIETIKKAPEISQTYYRLASLLYENGQISLDGAIKQCRQAVLMDDKNPDAYMYLGYFLALNDEKKEAKENFECAIKLNPLGSARARIVLAMTLLEGKKPDIKNILKASYCIFSGSLLFLMNKGGVKMLLNSILTDFNYLKFKTIGGVLESVKNDKKAYETYCDALDNTKNQPEFYKKMASLALKHKKTEVAYQCLRNRLVTSNNSPESLVDIIEFIEKYYPNNYDELIDYYNYLLRYDPKMSRCYYEIGHLYIKKEDYLNAISAFNLALKIEPKNPFYQNSLAFSYVQLEQYDAAIELYEKALKSNPDNEWSAIIAQALGVIYHQIKGDVDKAIETFEKALTLTKHKEDIYQGIADIYYDEDKLEEAIKYYQIALRYNKHDSRIYSRLGMSYWETDKIEESISNYQKAISIDPDYDIAYNNLGVVLLDGLGDPKRALSHFKRACEINPNYVLAHFNYARALEALDEKVEAANKYQTAINLNKISPEIDTEIIEERLFKLFDI